MEAFQQLLTKLICIYHRVMKEQLIIDWFTDSLRDSLHFGRSLTELSALVVRFFFPPLCAGSFQLLLPTCLHTPPFCLAPQPDTSPTPAAAATCVFTFFTYRWHALLRHQQPIRGPVGATAPVLLYFQVFEGGRTFSRVLKFVIVARLALCLLSSAKKFINNQAHRNMGRANIVRLTMPLGTLYEAIFFCGCVVSHYVT